MFFKRLELKEKIWCDIVAQAKVVRANYGHQLICDTVPKRSRSVKKSLVYQYQVFLRFGGMFWVFRNCHSGLRAGIYTDWYLFDGFPPSRE